MNASLRIFREVQGSYQFVGQLIPCSLGMQFLYAPEYMLDPAAKSISCAFPLQDEPFTNEQTRAFFEGLLPEGEMGRLFRQAFHSADTTYWESLAKLDCESSGALILSTSESSLKSNRAYRAFDQSELQEFSQQPRRVALRTGMASRLSLAGAQAKLGLYCDSSKNEATWYQPMGSAPSTHIIKASDETFEHLAINEALCMLTALYCGFDTAKVSLIPMTGCDLPPLLAVERFDRVIPHDAMLIDGCKVPHRLHQEDFCQAIGLQTYQKYEPTDGHYLSLAANLIAQTVKVPLGDRFMFFNRILFDYLIGNCDNHLKNHSFLWHYNWSGLELSPLYDVVCTTIYPELDRQMGVALCESRQIDDVRQADINAASRTVGIPEDLGWSLYLKLCDQLPKAVRQAENKLVSQGFAAASHIADFVLSDSSARRSL